MHIDNGDVFQLIQGLWLCVSKRTLKSMQIDKSVFKYKKIKSNLNAY